MSADLLSLCCTAPVRVVGSNEGTRWHECQACQNACDLLEPNSEPYNDADGVHSDGDGTPRYHQIGDLDE